MLESNAARLFFQLVSRRYETAMRIGRERYLDARGTRGAGTLYTRDVSVLGDDITVKFPAKSGKVAEYTLNDAKLAAAIGGRAGAGFGL